MRASVGASTHVHTRAHERAASTWKIWNAPMHFHFLARAVRISPLVKRVKDKSGSYGRFIDDVTTSLFVPSVCEARNSVSCSGKISFETLPVYYDTWELTKLNIHDLFTRSWFRPSPSFSSPSCFPWWHCRFYGITRIIPLANGEKQQERRNFPRVLVGYFVQPRSQFQSFRATKLSEVSNR